MKTNIIKLLLINIFMIVIAYGKTDADLRFVFTGSTRAEILPHLSVLNEKYRANSFDEQIFNDVSIAIRCIDRHAGSQKKLGFTEKQCEEYFIALTGNKNVKDIILAAAAIALSESSGLSHSKDPLERLDQNSDEYVKTRHLIWQRIWGRHFFETYALENEPLRPVISTACQVE